MNNEVRIILADKYDLVVGDTFQLFYRSVIEAPNPYVYAIVAECEKGKNFPRYFEYTPETPGQHKLKITLYDAQQNVLGSNETVLNVVQPKRTDKQVNILCIGASGTANGHWVSEVHRRLTKENHVPFGLGCPNIRFVGSCHLENPDVNEVNFEAYGGWTWHRFTSDKEGSMWIKCPNSRTQEDQHSLWQDENGAIWQLETLQTDYLKFNRYKEHTSPRPESGFLTHYANAENQEPIPILSSSTEKVSPFYDPQSKKIDFKTYALRNHIDTIDAVYIVLGLNGLVRSEAMHRPRAEYCKIVISEAKVLIDAMKRDFPNVKVKIVSPYPPSVTGGCGFSYGAQPPYADRFDLLHYLFELNIAYQAWANEEEYRDFVEFVGGTGQFDAEHNYPVMEKPVNTRSAVTETIATNGLHPTVNGYYQFGDAIFRNIVKEFCSE